jgi:hypothetical protein
MNTSTLQPGCSRSLPHCDRPAELVSGHEPEGIAAAVASGASGACACHGNSIAGDGGGGCHPPHGAAAVRTTSTSFWILSRDALEHTNASWIVLHKLAKE